MRQVNYHATMRESMMQQSHEQCACERWIGASTRVQLGALASAWWGRLNTSTMPVAPGDVPDGPQTEMTKEEHNSELIEKFK